MFPIEAVSKFLLDYGLPGIVILGLSFWVVKLTKDLKVCQEARVTELQQMAKTSETVAAAMAAWVPAQEARGRGADSLVEVIKASLPRIDSLERNIAAAMDSHRQMREALIRVLQALGKDINV